MEIFTLQAHYRSTLDITDDSLQAAEKAYRRLMESMRILKNMQLDFAKESAAKDETISSRIAQNVSDIDDFNVPKPWHRCLNCVP